MTIDTFSFRYADTAGFMEWFRYNPAQGLWIDRCDEAMEERYHYVYDRSQVREKREKTEIGIHAVRGGNIVGEHDVIFAGRDEVIELTHRATSREVFAVGAVKAAKFLAGKPAGLYTMKEVLQ